MKIAINLYLEAAPVGGMRRALELMRGAGATRIGSTAATPVPIEVAIGEPDMLRYADEIDVTGADWTGFVSSGPVWSIGVRWVGVTDRAAGLARAGEMFDRLLAFGRVDFAVCHWTEGVSAGRDVAARRAAILCECPDIVYRDDGPAGLGWRTALGPRILAMLDVPTRDTLVRGGELREDGRLVLVDPPVDLQTRFEASGVAMQVDDAGKTSAGPRWQPLDDAPVPELEGESEAVIDRLQSVRFADGDPAVTDVTCANLYAPFARLESTHAEMLEVENAVLAYAELSGSVIHDAGFVGADLHGVDARGAQWIDASFHSADLRWANCAEIRLPASRLDHANCTAIVLTDAVGPEAAEDACFDRANAERWSPTDAQLNRATFRDANLRGAKFDKARLQGAVFDGADLTGASFRDADLRGATFVRATTTGIDLTGANIEGSVFDT